MDIRISIEIKEAMNTDRTMLSSTKTDQHHMTGKTDRVHITREGNSITIRIGEQDFKTTSQTI